MSTPCLLCNKSGNLNTVVKIVSGDDQIDANVCDDCAGDHPISRLRSLAQAAYDDRVSNIDSMKSQLESLGMIVLTKAEYDALVNQKVDKPVEQNRQMTRQVKQDTSRGRQISAAEFQAKSGRPLVSSSNGVSAGANPYAITGEIRSFAEGAMVEPEVFNGPDGMPVVIPKKIVDRTGTTNIRIIRSKPADAKSMIGAIEQGYPND